MSFRQELSKGFCELEKLIRDNNEAELLLLPYAAFSVALFTTYHDVLYKGLLHPKRPLAKAFCELGIDEPNSQLLLFIDIFYIHWHTQDEFTA